MEDLLTDLAREIRGKRYGKYLGVVAKNADPEHRGRLRLRVPSVFGQDETGWVLPCVPFGGLAGHGMFAIPEVGARVWVDFEEGDPSRPIWTGTFWQQQADVPEEARIPDKPTTRLFRTPSGHALRFDDEQGKERVTLRHRGGAEILVDEHGSVSITDQQGATLVLDAQNGKVRIEDTHGNTILLRESGATIEDKNGNTIEMAAAGVTIKSKQIVLDAPQVMLGGQGGEQILKGSSFLSLFATHVHTATSVGGPTSPPTPQGEQSSLATGVTTK